MATCHFHKKLFTYAECPLKKKAMANELLIRCTGSGGITEDASYRRLAVHVGAKRSKTLQWKTCRYTLEIPF